MEEKVNTPLNQLKEKILADILEFEKTNDCWVEHIDLFTDFTNELKEIRIWTCKK